MNLKLVISISVCNLTWQTGRKIDNLDSFKRTFLDALTASNTEKFCNKCNFRSLAHFNTLFPALHYWAIPVALKSTFLWFTFFRIHNSDSCLLLFILILDSLLCLRVSLFLSVIFLLNFNFPRKI